MERKAYPSDVSDAEWALVAPYLTLMTEDAPQRDYPLREVFNGLRWMARGGSSWRMMPHDLPPYYVVYQQMRRWLKAGVFEAITHDLRAVLRIAEGRQEMPTASIFDSRTLQSTVESGARAGYDGAKRRKGNKVHLAVDTLGHLLALCVTAANEQDRAQVANSPNACRPRPARRSRSHMWIKATRARMPPMRPPSTGSNSKSSNSRKRREASSSCLADGWWNEVLVGCLDSAG